MWLCYVAKVPSHPLPGCRRTFFSNEDRFRSNVCVFLCKIAYVRPPLDSLWNWFSQSSAYRKTYAQGGPYIVSRRRHTVGAENLAPLVRPHDVSCKKANRWHQD